MKRMISLLPLLALAALAVLFLAYGLHRDPQIKPDALVGKPLPARVMARLETGERISLLDARRQVTGSGPVVVNMFASWCAPCAEEHPVLMALKAQGVPLIGVAYKDTPNHTRGFLNRLGNPFLTVLTDIDGQAGLDLGISGVPESFLVAPDGTILAKHTGPMTPDTAEQFLEKAAASR